MESLNQSLFVLMNAGPDASHGVVRVAKFLAEWPIVFSIVLAGVALSRQKNILFTLQTILITAIAMLGSYVIRSTWPHPRPFVVGIGNTLAFHEATPSFPSLHATFLFALGLSLLLNKRSLVIAVTILVFALSTAWSRIYIGVHFPEDMMAAFIVGLVSLLLVSTGMRMKEKFSPC